jgi:hypothetical protein
MKKYLFIDESILYFLLVSHPIKNEIYQQLKYLIQQDYQPVSSIYNIFKLKEFLFRVKQKQIFFEFFNDLENFLQIIYSLDPKDIKNSILLSKQFDLDFDLAYIIYSMNNNKINDLYSLQYKDKKDFVKNKFNIDIIFPYYENYKG